MKRHDRGLGKAGDKENIGDGDPQVIGRRRENTGADIVGKIKRPRHDIGQDQGRQKKALGSSHEINQIFLGPGIPLRILMVSETR